MITLEDINTAVNNKIKCAINNFGYNIPLVSEDLREPIIRPSIKVCCENSKSEKLNEDCKERTVTFSVYFFPENKHKPKNENIKVREVLENSFLEPLTITDSFVAPIDNLDFEVTDGILVMTFDVYTIEIIPESNTYEQMEEVIFNI